MTFNEGRGHSKRFQIYTFSDVFHHTKFEGNRFVNVRMQGAFFGGGGGGGWCCLFLFFVFCLGFFFGGGWLLLQFLFRNDLRRVFFFAY